MTAYHRDRLTHAKRLRVLRRGKAKVATIVVCPLTVALGPSG